MGAQNWPGKAQRYGPIRVVRAEYGWPALVVRVVNGVSRDAGAGTANLIYRHGRISG